MTADQDAENLSSPAPQGPSEAQGAESPPPAAPEEPKKRKSRKPKAETQADAQQPWANFNEVPPDHNVVAADRAMKKKMEEESQLVLAPGFSRYRCRRDCGSGKYRKGTFYTLPDGQPEALFEKVE